MSHRERREFAAGWVVGDTWVPWNSQISLKTKVGSLAAMGLLVHSGDCVHDSHITHPMAVMICFLKYSAESPDNGAVWALEDYL